MSALDKFGKFLMLNFRDRALDQFEGLFMAKWKSPEDEALQNELAQLTGEEKELLRKCVTEIVDTGLHDFLRAIQQAHDLQEGVLIFVDGDNVAEESGMLHGEPIGEDGWISRFSNHR